MEKQTALVRPGMLAILAVAMLIPLFYLMGIINDRERYFTEASESVFSGWGREQRVFTPVFRLEPKPEEGAWQVEDSQRAPLLIPQNVNVQVNVNHSMRTRGVFELPVYVADVTMTGVFRAPKDSMGRLYLQLSDLGAIVDLQVKLNDIEFEMTPMLRKKDEHNVNILQALSSLTSSEPVAFDIRYSVRGSQYVEVVAPAQKSTIDVRGTWPHPSFQGQMLPESRTLTEQGFTARWQATNVASALTQARLQVDMDQMLSLQGPRVDLYEPVSLYRSVHRGAKYGLLFIGVTLLTLFCFELATGHQLHLIQHATTGGAVLVFFLALMALAEHMPFGIAYCLSAVLVIGLATWYVGQVTNNKRFNAMFCGMLVTIYSVLYLLLRMEAYSLLGGTAVVIAGLFALMWSTRELNN